MRMSASLKSNTLVTKEALEDHLVAHDVNHSTDSALAQLLFEEENWNERNVNSSTETSIQDQLLARRLHQEEMHKQEEKSFNNLKETYGMSSNGEGFVKQYDKQMQKKVQKNISVADYFKEKANMMSFLMEGEDSCQTRTQDLVPAIHGVYTRSSLKKTCYLCTNIDFFGGDVADKGWGCGYRNCQMLLSSLQNSQIYIEAIKAKLGSIKIPSVPFLQDAIEKAWKAGYDIAGCEQLGGKLRGTRKWIGTTEVAAFLRWMNIRARIVDFHKPSGGGKTHPELFKWIENYFKSRLSTGAFPVYLQHQGHSRTCVGIEKNKSDKALSLLIFDPSFSSHKMQNIKDIAAEKKTLTSIQYLKKSVKQMKSDQFQLLFVDGLYRDSKEIENISYLFYVKHCWTIYKQLFYCISEISQQS